MSTQKSDPNGGKSSTISEADVIGAITRRFRSKDPRVIAGVGDDCAIVRVGDLTDSARRLNAADLLFTTDLLIESVHFSLKYMSLEDIGYKALAVNLSDIAAMGGAPRYALGNLGVPREATAVQVQQLLDGVAAAASLAEVELIGGDTVAAPQWVVGFTVTGEVQGAPLLRSGARPGDVLWHSGALGLSQVGLYQLWGGEAQVSPEARLAHLRPEPQLALGRELQRCGLVSAALDLSDSVAQCALLIAQASRVGLLLDLQRYPFAAPVADFLNAHKSRSRASQFALPAKLSPGGKREVFTSAAQFIMAAAEDYQLLFTATPGATPQLKRCALACGVTLQALGRITDANEGCFYRDELGQIQRLTALGFEHLAPRGVG